MSEKELTLEYVLSKRPELSNVEVRKEDHKRDIKSFVLRGQKLRQVQLNALLENYDKHCLTYTGQKLDFSKIFGNDNPVVIEIGFGMGESTIEIAKTNPNINYLGLEVFLFGFSKVLVNIEKEDLKNLKIMRFDATDVVKNLIEDNSISGFHIFFPDPWPKKKHHRRRLINDDFVKLLTSKLKKGGYIYCATDWEDYANQMLEVLSNNNDLQNPYPGFAPRISWRPVTGFETKGLKQNFKINEVWFEKNC